MTRIATALAVPLAVFWIVVLACLWTARPAHAARYPDAQHVVYSTAELRANVHRGPRCLFVDNLANLAVVGHRAYYYVSDGDEHIVWERGVPAYVAARTEVVFAKIAAYRDAHNIAPGHIGGYVCGYPKPSDVPA